MLVKFSPELPHSCGDATMIEYKNSLILIGGTGDVEGDALYQLYSPDGPWIKMKQTLKNKRYEHISFLVPDELVTCYQQNND